MNSVRARDSAATAADDDMYQLAAIERPYARTNSTYGTDRRRNSWRSVFEVRSLVVTGLNAATASASCAAFRAATGWGMDTLKAEPERSKDTSATPSAVNCPGVKFVDELAPNGTLFRDYRAVGVVGIARSVSIADELCSSSAPDRQALLWRVVSLVERLGLDDERPHVARLRLVLPLPEDVEVGAGAWFTRRSWSSGRKIDSTQVNSEFRS